MTWKSWPSLIPSASRAASPLGQLEQQIVALGASRPLCIHLVACSTVAAADELEIAKLAVWVVTKQVGAVPPWLRSEAPVLARTIVIARRQTAGSGPAWDRWCRWRSDWA